MSSANIEKFDLWELYIDGSSMRDYTGAGIILISPNRQYFCPMLRFKFPATNNEVEYKAIVAGLDMAKLMGITSLIIHSDLQLIVNQILKH